MINYKATRVIFCNDIIYRSNRIKVCSLKKKNHTILYLKNWSAEYNIRWTNLVLWFINYFTLTYLLYNASVGSVINCVIFVLYTPTLKYKVLGIKF